MMKITKENNLSETALAIKEYSECELRWFTPSGEIALCGHATLATTFVITNFYEPEAEDILFNTLSGKLKILRKRELYEMDFLAYDLQKVNITDEMVEAIGVKPDMCKVKELESLLICY